MGITSFGVFCRSFAKDRLIQILDEAVPFLALRAIRISQSTCELGNSPGLLLWLQPFFSACFYPLGVSRPQNPISGALAKSTTTPITRERLPTVPKPSVWSQTLQRLTTTAVLLDCPKKPDLTRYCRRRIMRTSLARPEWRNGRRSGLKIRWRVKPPWGFESPLGHQPRKLSGPAGTVAATHSNNAGASIGSDFGRSTRASTARRATES